MGDIVLLTPAVRLMKDWRRDLGIAVVIESQFQELLESNPNVDEILSPGEGQGVGKVMSRLRAVGELRRRQFALCVNLHGGPTSSFLTNASGARWRAGFDYVRGRRGLDFRVPLAQKILGQDIIHTAEHQASVFFYLGLPRREIPRAELYLKAEHRAWWQEKQKELGLSPRQGYAIVHPTALYATKQWAPEHFAQLGLHLSRELQLEAVFSCGPGESAVLDAVERAAGRPILRLQGARLGQFAAALAEARIFIGNDSGPAHLAGALARPVVVIFGSSSSAIWGPWPRDARGLTSQIVQNHYECNPCPGDRCYRFERPECILSVTFEQVRSAVESVLIRSARK